MLELLKRLPAQIAVIHEEEYALCASVLDEPIDKNAGSVSLATTAGHLDERPRTSLGKRLLQIADCRDLCRPQTVGREWRKIAKPGTKRPAGMLEFLGATDRESPADGSQKRLGCVTQGPEDS